MSPIYGNLEKYEKMAVNLALFCQYQQRPCWTAQTVRWTMGMSKTKERIHHMIKKRFPNFPQGSPLRISNISR